MHGHMSEFGCRHLGHRCGAGMRGRGWKPFPLPGAPKRWSRDRQVDVLAHRARHRTRSAHGAGRDLSLRNRHTHRASLPRRAEGAASRLRGTRCLGVQRSVARRRSFEVDDGSALDHLASRTARRGCRLQGRDRVLRAPRDADCTSCARTRITRRNVTRSGARARTRTRATGSRVSTTRTRSRRARWWSPCPKSFRVLSNGERGQRRRRTAARR